MEGEYKMTHEEREWKCTDAHPNSPQMGKNYKGFADLTHTNMCYRCDYCDQGFNQIFMLHQLALEYFICSKCKEYYKATFRDLIELKYVETRQEWQDADCWPRWLPYPIGFDE